MPSLKVSKKDLEKEIRSHVKRCDTCNGRLYCDEGALMKAQLDQTILLIKEQELHDQIDAHLNRCELCMPGRGVRCHTCQRLYRALENL